MNFTDNIIRVEVSHRGGGIEIDLTKFGFGGHRMTAYQNYLGGGMLGAICNDCTISDWYDNDDLTEIAENLSRFFHELTNPSDEWSGMTFEQRQNMPKSAF
jgi:hypothetical protein